MLTPNEKKVLKLIIFSFDTDYSINQIAKECKLSANGAYKILLKYEKEGILQHKNIANLKSYKIDFKSDKTASILELVLIPELDKKIKLRLDDLKEVREVSSACIFFGSYINKKDPNDLDVIFVIDKNKYKNYSEKIAVAKEIIPIKVHDVVQTFEDLKQNILSKDKIVLSALKEGVILWGYNVVIQVIKDVYN
jgi:hypothetical protein